MRPACRVGGFLACRQCGTLPTDEGLRVRAARSVWRAVWEADRAVMGWMGLGTKTRDRHSQCVIIHLLETRMVQCVGAPHGGCRQE